MLGRRSRRYFAQLNRGARSRIYPPQISLINLYSSNQMRRQQEYYFPALDLVLVGAKQIP